MSEFAVTGEGLKDAIKLARKFTMSFAFNSGKGPKEHMLGLDKRKAPDLVGRSVKKSGPSGKVAFGTCSVDGKLMLLICAEPLPAMAKKLKKFLRHHGLSMNVEIRAPDGTVLDAEADPETGDGAKHATKTADLETKPPAEPREAPEAALDPGDLIARLKALQPQIKAVPGAPRAKMAKVAKKAGGLITSGDLETASQLIDTLEQALSRATVASDSAKDPDPKLEQLRQAHGLLGERVGALTDAGQKAKLLQVLLKVGQLLDTGELDGAAKGIKAVQGALQKLGPASQQDAEISVPPLPPQIDLAALRNQLKQLAGQIAPAAGDDTTKRKALAALAQEGSAALKAQDPDTAITKITELRAALETDPIHKPLMLPIWRTAKDQANDQLGQLQDAMKQSGVPIFERIADAGLNSVTETRLVAFQVGLLELDAAAGGNSRSKAEEKLRTAMQEMRSFVDTSPVLPLLDKNPLKIPVKLRATLTKALDDIDRALAA